MRVEEITLTGTDGAPLVTIEKRLSTRERGEPESAARLRGEASLLARLGGRVTPRLVAAGEDDRGPWLRTEKLPFPTLAERLLRGGGGAALDADWIERAAQASFAALAELHDACDAEGPLRIVHADLSPANLAFDDAGARAALLDLELACWREGAARDGAFRGTIAYAAPEVARGEAPTPRSDLFALAATLLHAVLGAPPREGPSLAALLALAAERPIFDAPELARLTDRAIAARGPGHAAIVRCLAHAPEARPGSARDVLALLR
jgi:serine/threonine protein kinase